MNDISLTVEDFNGDVIGRSDSIGNNTKLKISIGSYMYKDIPCILKFNNLDDYIAVIKVSKENGDDEYINVSENDSNINEDFVFEDGFSVTVVDIEYANENKDQIPE